jgi:hypothetical protein
MKTIFNYLFFLIIILSIGSCKKNTDYLKINGSIYNPANQSHISNVDINLFAKGVSSGVYSAGFNQIATTTSNQQGFYEILIPKEKSDLYRLHVHKPEYFTKTIEFSANVFTQQNTYVQNIELHSSGYIQLRIVNAYPFDEEDVVVFYFTNTNEVCIDCCSNSSNKGLGPQFDTTIVCKFYGDSYVHFLRSVKKNNQTNIYTDSLFCPAFSVSEYVIQY